MGGFMSLKRIIWSFLAGTSIFLAGCEKVGDDTLPDGAADQDGGGDIAAVDTGEEDDWTTGVPMYGARGCSIGNVK
jgi:hypothetical protein